MDTFSCRLFHADFYLSAPLPLLDTAYSYFRGEAVSLVPVIRIFGAAPNGQKACVHIHGVFPYLLVPASCQKVTDSLLHRLANSIDYALQVSLGGGSRRGQHVFKIIPVEAKSFYGYTARESTFLKVYLYRPSHVKRLAELLLAGAIMNQVFQPFEAHIPYVLQFMVDYNLYGMSQVHLGSVKFRHIGQENLSPLTQYCRWQSNSTESEVTSILRPCLHEAPRISACELECDAVAADILNRTHESTQHHFSKNPGINALWEDERDRRQSNDDLDQLKHLMDMHLPSEVPMLDTETKLIQEFVESASNLTSSELQKESSTFGSLSGHEGTDTEEDLSDNSYCVDKDIASKESLNLPAHASDDDVLTLLLQLASTPSQQTQSNPRSQVSPVSLSVADVLVQSVCSGHVDSSFCHSLTHDSAQSDESYTATQLPEAGDNRGTEGNAHDCILPFSQTPSTPSTPIPKLGISPFCAARPLITELLPLLSPNSCGQINIGNEENIGSIDSEASTDMDNLFKLLCEHQDDEAETLHMSQAFWDTEEQVEHRQSVTALEPKLSVPQVDGSNGHSKSKITGTVKKHPLDAVKGQSAASTSQALVSPTRTLPHSGISSQGYSQSHVHSRQASGLTHSSLIEKAKHSSLFPLVSQLKTGALLQASKSLGMTFHSSADVTVTDPSYAVSPGISDVLANPVSVGCDTADVHKSRSHSTELKRRHVSLSLNKQKKARKISSNVPYDEGKHPVVPSIAVLSPLSSKSREPELRDVTEQPSVETVDQAQAMESEKQHQSTIKAVSTVLKLISASTNVPVAQKSKLKQTVKQMNTRSQQVFAPVKFDADAPPSEVAMQHKSTATMQLAVACNESSDLGSKDNESRSDSIPDISQVQPRKHSHDSERYICLNTKGKSQNGALLNFTPICVPPTMEALLRLAKECGIPVVAHKEVYYSNSKDIQKTRTVGEKDLLVKSCIPWEQEEFKAVFTSGHRSCWPRAADLQHWRVILSTLMVDRSSPTIPIDSQFCYDACSYVDLIPAVPPPTLKQLTASPKQIGSALQGHGPNLSAAQLSPAFAQSMETDQQKYSEVVLEPKISRPRPGTVLHKAVGTLMKKSPLVTPKQDTSQIEGPSPKNVFGFEFSPSDSGKEKEKRKQTSQAYYLTTFSAELHVQTRGTKQPDPSHDAVLAVFYYIHNDWPCSGNVQDSTESYEDSNVEVGIIALSSSKMLSSKFVTPYLHNCGIADHVKITYVDCEEELLSEVASLIERTNPDVLVGYNTEQLSWGYLLDRASQLNINLKKMLSRAPEMASSDLGMQRESSTAHSEKSDLHITGRYCLDLWRLLQHEIALRSYTFENVAFHVLHERLPHFSFPTLSEWYLSSDKQLRWQVVDYYLKRCTGNVCILHKFNIMERTCEFAKLYGILFSSVLTRGSQFRVESMMLRLAHSLNFIAVSPGVHQRARMAAPECVPLILEPESRFFTDPVLVMDFQSLYPSIIIAHNYCYSTCLGKMKYIVSREADFPFGAVSHSIPPDTVKLVSDEVTISPVGVVFVKPSIRKGVLPQLLQEILATRVMVKSSMKLHKCDRNLERILDARQLGLKLIANVTYGYTAAHFSGRMPCVEIADSIVSKGRETLQQAIRLVNSTEQWGGRVVYGDTDSMFVMLRGASKEDAFKIGEEIAEKVTTIMPKPLKLKFEKVYYPCLLQAKKRYFGYMYEAFDQKEPIFDAKGIETVRRDSCQAVAKILEKSVRILFESKDVSKVKLYVQRQLLKLLSDRVSLADYTIAKEFRGMGRYQPGACVPSLKLAKQSVAADERDEPRAGERVPYIIVYGTPGSPIIDLVRRPTDILTNSSLRLNGVYYATKQILPALDRTFSLLGVNVFQWYQELPILARASTQYHVEERRAQKSTLVAYFPSTHCPLCGHHTQEVVCTECTVNKQKLFVSCSEAIKQPQQTLVELHKLCQNCCKTMSLSVTARCSSIDCPVYLGCQRQMQKTTSQDRLEEVMSRLEQW